MIFRSCSPSSERVILTPAGVLRGWTSNNWLSFSRRSETRWTRLLRRLQVRGRRHNTSTPGGAQASFTVRQSPRRRRRETLDLFQDGRQESDGPDGWSWDTNGSICRFLSVRLSVCTESQQPAVFLNLNKPIFSPSFLLSSANRNTRKPSKTWERF